MGKIITLFTLTLIILLMIGCTSPSMEGIILEVKEDYILLSQDLSNEEYEEIKDESVSELRKEDIYGERDSLALIELTYKKADRFKKGDRVEVWIDGDIMTSYPAQAKAKKLKLRK